jgi:hypothetical protein
LSDVCFSYETIWSLISPSSTPVLRALALAMNNTTTRSLRLDPFAPTALVRLDIFGINATGSRIEPVYSVVPPHIVLLDVPLDQGHLEGVMAMRPLPSAIRITTPYIEQRFTKQSTQLILGYLPQYLPHILAASVAPILGPRPRPAFPPLQPQSLQQNVRTSVERVRRACEELETELLWEDEVEGYCENAISPAYWRWALQKKRGKAKEAESRRSGSSTM